jgi:hypothetical protein
MGIKETFRRHLKERYMEDAVKKAYTVMCDNQARAERENSYIDGFAEKDAIISSIRVAYHLNEHEAEDVYFAAVRLMDKRLRDMRWWFQRKKAETTGRDITNSPSNRPLVSSRAVALPRGEQLVLLRRVWDHYVELRDGLPGIVQITAEGFNDIAHMMSIMVDDPTTRPIIYSNTPSHPNSLEVRGEHIGDIAASLGPGGVSFGHAGKDYFTDAANATGNMLGLLDSLWPDRRFLFAFGWTCHELNDQRTEYYLSGPKSIPNGFDSLLAMSWYEGPNTSPDLQITLESGAAYAVTWVPGGKGPQMTRIE